MTQARNEAEDYKAALIAERDAYKAAGREDRVAEVEAVLSALSGGPKKAAPKEKAIADAPSEKAVEDKPQPAEQSRRPGRRPKFDDSQA